MKRMTVSVSKGKMSESDFKHNLRKELLKTDKEKRKFYEQKGHSHIKPEYLSLNRDLLHGAVKDVYSRLYENSVEEYNKKQTRKDRKIGKGQALTRQDKLAKIYVLSLVKNYRKLSKKDQQSFLSKYDPNLQVALKKMIALEKDKSVADISKDLTKARHAETLGEAYYKKVKASKQQEPVTELLFQVGSAEDFNQMKNGKIDQTLDRRDPSGIWQRSADVLERFYKGFKKRNPNLVPVSASIHMDENSPHLHLQVVPVAEQTKTTARGKTRRNGLRLKTSFNGALENEGFKRDKKDRSKAFSEWQQIEQQELAKVLEQELGIKRKKGKTNKFKNVHEYKEYKAFEAKQVSKNVSLKVAGVKLEKQNKITKEKLDSNKEALAKGQEKLNIIENKTKQKQDILKNLNDKITNKQSKSKDLDNKLQEKQNALTALNTQIIEKQKRDKKLQEQYEKRKKDAEKRLKSWYKAKKGQYRTQATILKNLKQVYVGCVQTWIETVAPETKHQATTPVFNKPLDHSESWYMARGHYRSEFKPEDSQPSLYYVKSALDYRKPRERPTAILKGIKAVAKKFGSYLCDKKTLEVVKQLDSIDIPEAVKTAPEAKKQRRMKVYTKGSMTVDVEKTHDQQQDKDYPDF